MDELKKLGEEDVKIELRICLEGGRECGRNGIIGEMGIYGIEDVVKEGLWYCERDNGKIVFGYLVLGGINEGG